MAEISKSPIIITSKEHLQTLDLETATFVVQSTRAKLMQEQLKGQVSEVQQTNERIGKINGALTASRELSAKFSDKDGNSKEIEELIKKDTEDFKKTDEWKARDKGVKDEHEKDKNKRIKEQERQIDEAKNYPGTSEEFKKMRIKQINEYIKEIKKETAPKTPFNPKIDTASGAAFEKLKIALKTAALSLDPKTKSDLTVAIENINTTIDSLSNSQQMNMVRLQNISGKANESHELITNFIKKMRDTLSSLIANLRS